MASDVDVIYLVLRKDWLRCSGMKTAADRSAETTTTGENGLALLQGPGGTSNLMLTKLEKAVSRDWWSTRNDELTLFLRPQEVTIRVLNWVADSKMNNQGLIYAARSALSFS